MKNEVLNILGYKVNCVMPKWDFRQKNCMVANCLNPHSYVTAKGREEYRKALLGSDILLPDGDGVVIAAKFLEGEDINKCAGMDMQLSMLEQLNNQGGKCFYLGGSEDTLKAIEARLSDNYPNVKFLGASPSYFKEEMPAEENEVYIRMIKAERPDVVFVGLGTMKQEEWAEKNRKRLEGTVSYICTIGAAFAMLAGTYPRAPKYMIEHKIEWLYRLVKEPKRMWRRNFVSTPIFLFDIMKAKLAK